MSWSALSSFLATLRRDDGGRLSVRVRVAKRVSCAVVHEHFVDNGDELFESVVAVLCSPDTFVP